MAKKFALLIIPVLIITISFAGSSESKDSVVNATGGGLWPTSSTSLVKEEVDKLNPGDTVTIIIETENKHLISSAIKLEKLPVVFEEIEDRNLTRFIIRLK